MRSHRSVVAAAVAASLLFSGIEAAATAPASSAAGLRPVHPTLYVVTFNSESVESGIAHHAATDAAFRASAARLTALWLSKLRSAKSMTISGLGEADHTAQVESIARLHANLVSGDLPRTELTSKTGSMATATPSAVTTLSVDGNNPNSFAVRGRRVPAGRTGRA